MTFSLSSIRGDTTPVSGGGPFFSLPLPARNLLHALPRLGRHYVNHPVDVGPKPPVPVALALDKLDEALLLEEVQVALDGSGGAGKPSSQGLHPRPAEASLVVGVVGEGCVGGDDLGWHPRQNEVLDLRDTGESGSDRHVNLLEAMRRVRSGDLCK